jgi:hypothetical protein
MGQGQPRANRISAQFTQRPKMGEAPCQGHIELIPPCTLARLIILVVVGGDGAPRRRQSLLALWRSSADSASGQNLHRSGSGTLSANTNARRNRQIALDCDGI